MVKGNNMANPFERFSCRVELNRLLDLEIYKTLDGAISYAKNGDYPRSQEMINRARDLYNFESKNKLWLLEKIEEVALSRMEYFAGLGGDLEI